MSVWQKCQMRHEPTLFYSSLVKSESAWLLPEFKFEAWEEKEEKRWCVCVCVWGGGGGGGGGGGEGSFYILLIENHYASKWKYYVSIVYIFRPNCMFGWGLVCTPWYA